METKTIYREYFPGYMGHIPMKNEVIGMTVGATNGFIKSYLAREPDYEQNLIPKAQENYNTYNKNYFNENFSKEYKLDEDKIQSNRSKDAHTWLNGSKYKIYPQHVPGYKAHVPGIYSSNIFGINYARSTAVAVKGDYCKTVDLPPKERYTTVSKSFFTNPRKKPATERSKSIEPSKTANAFHSRPDIPETFRKALNSEKKEQKELPYIVGYKGFRRGVRAGNYYGKNFRETSLSSCNKFINQ